MFTFHNIKKCSTLILLFKQCSRVLVLENLEMKLIQNWQAMKMWNMHSLFSLIGEALNLKSSKPLSSCHLLRSTQGLWCIQGGDSWRGVLGLDTRRLCVERDWLASSRSHRRGRWELGSASCTCCASSNHMKHIPAVAMCWEQCKACKVTGRYLRRFLHWSTGHNPSLGSSNNGNHSTESYVLCGIYTHRGQCSYPDRIPKGACSHPSLHLQDVPKVSTGVWGSSKNTCERRAQAELLSLVAGLQEIDW